MSKIRDMHAALLKRILDGAGHASPADRRKAFEDAGLEGPAQKLVDTVAHDAHRVTDDDVAATKAAGLGEDQIFELVICAAVGASTRQYNVAMAALDAATKKD